MKQLYISYIPSSEQFVSKNKSLPRLSSNSTKIRMDIYLVVTPVPAQHKAVYPLDSLDRRKREATESRADFLLADPSAFA